MYCMMTKEARFARQWVRIFCFRTSHLTDSGKGNLVTGKAERLPVLRPILLSSESYVTAEATEVVQMPVLVFCTCVLMTQNQLQGIGGGGGGGSS